MVKAIEVIRRRHHRRIHQAHSQHQKVDGRIGEGHVVIFFNYRNDRAKELTAVLTQHEEEA